MDVLGFNQWQWLKQYIEFNAKKERSKNGNTDGRELYKLMDNAVYDKMDYLKWTSNPSYMSQKNVHNDLVAIWKSIVT